MEAVVTLVNKTCRKKLYCLYSRAYVEFLPVKDPPPNSMGKCHSIMKRALFERIAIDAAGPFPETNLEIVIYGLFG